MFIVLINIGIYLKRKVQPEADILNMHLVKCVFYNELHPFAEGNNKPANGGEFCP